MQHVRSNNHVEGWHNRINLDGKPQMNFYYLVNLLFDEANLIPVQREPLSRNKLSSESKKNSKNLTVNCLLCGHEPLSSTS